ncbi:hypothetical protein EDB80DRAFT_72237 [Ilyonectria destructans]|nr:hypothetical protein EDB80DRAFT_72237 [Ilyonectria destructans]
MAQAPFKVPCDWLRTGLSGKPARRGRWIGATDLRGRGGIASYFPEAAISGGGGSHLEQHSPKAASSSAAFRECSALRSAEEPCRSEEAPYWSQQKVHKVATHGTEAASTARFQPGLDPTVSVGWDLRLLDQWVVHHREPQPPQSHEGWHLWRATCASRSLLLWVRNSRFAGVARHMSCVCVECVCRFSTEYDAWWIYPLPALSLAASTP